MLLVRALLLRGSLAVLLAAAEGAGRHAAAAPAVATPPAPQRAVQVESLEHRPPAHPAAVEPAQERGLRPSPAEVTVPAQERAARSAARGGRLQVGVPRPVPATADPARTARLLHWQRSAGASAAAVTFTVEGARGLRLGLLVRKLPAAAVIRGYVRDGATLFRATGHEVLAAIAANRRAGDLSDDGATWWTPVIDGPELTLEIQLPAGATPDAVEIAVPRISQLGIDAHDLQQNVATSACCEVDSPCSSVAPIQAGNRADCGGRAPCGTRGCL